MGRAEPMGKMGVMPVESMGLGARNLWRMAFNSRFVRDVLLLSGGIGIAQLIALTILPVLTRLYSPKDFGVLTLYISIVTLLSVFTSFDYERMIMLSRSHRSASQPVWLVLAISTGAARVGVVILGLFRHKIADLLGAPDVVDWLFAVPALLVCASGYRALSFWKMRLRQFAVVSRSMVANSFAFAVTATLFAFTPIASQQAAGLILAFICSEVVKTHVLIQSVRKLDSKEFAAASSRRIGMVGRRHGPMALTMSLSTGMGLIYDRIPDFLISSFFGAATLGLYGMIERIVAAPSRLVSRAIGDVYRQRASVLHRTQGRFDVLTLKTIATTALISFVPFLLAVIHAQELFSVLLGPQWESAGRYASILLVGEFFAFTITPIDNAPVIVGAKRFIFLWSLARLLLTLSLFPLLLFGVLNFVGFLWATVTIRILMVSLDGAASLQFARTGRPVLERPLWWGRSAETRPGDREQQNAARPERSATKLGSTTRQVDRRMFRAGV